MPCPSDSAAGKPCFGPYPLTLQQRNRVLMTNPINCQMHQLYKIPPGAEDDLPCAQRLITQRSVKISPPVSSQHPPTQDCLYALSALQVSSRCLQAVPPALLLGRAVYLERCLLAMSSLHPRSLAQISSRGSAQGYTVSAPSGLPPGVPGAPCLVTFKM